jgi:hypothetical protein
MEDFERLLDREFCEQFRRIFASLLAECANLRELTARVFDGRPLGAADLRSIAVSIEKTSRNVEEQIEQLLLLDGGT